METDLLNFAGSGILGGLLGGVFRLAPEILKFFDRKNERQHELNMFSMQTDLEKVKGNFKLDEKYADYGIAQLNASVAAFNEQAETASKSYKWVAALSALVRPAITYALFGMYMGIKVAFIISGLDSGDSWQIVLSRNWTADDFAMLNAVLMFWFLNRSIERYSK